MFMAPMRLKRYEEPFNDDEYIFEPLLAGNRLIFSQRDRITRLYTSSGRDVTRLFPELYHIAIDEDIVLDGAVALVNPQTGLIDRDCVNDRCALRDIREIRRRAVQHPVNLIVFDVLYYGRDLRGLPLIMRKEILNGLTLGNPHIGKTPYIESDGRYMFEEIRSRKMIGICAKRKDSLYSPSEEEWLSIVNWQRGEFYISGYRTDNFALIVSTKDPAGSFKEVGQVTSGFTAIDKMTFLTVCKQLELEVSGRIVQVTPYIRVEVRYLQTTLSGRLQGAEFVRFV